MSMSDACLVVKFNKLRQFTKKHCTIQPTPKNGGCVVKRNDLFFGRSADEMDVKWHAFFDFDKDFYKERTDLVEDWDKALKSGEMRETEDLGLFVREFDDQWVETDPKHTLKET